MNVLFIGVGQGSWQIRGVQIARELGARATTDPTDADWSWAEIVVLVKRAVYAWGAHAQASRARVIWDALDFWRQPDENQLASAILAQQIRVKVERYGIAQVIGATEVMAKAINGVCIPHHSRPGLTPQPPRREFKVVAYEGTPKYLGSWRKALEASCARLGLSLVVNPPDLREADLIVALRGEKWDGWICRDWKSGVKYANAIAAGRPILTQPHAAFREVNPAGTLVTDPVYLDQHIMRWSAFDAREAAYERCRNQAHAVSLASIAAQYRLAFQNLLQVAA